jgi:ABC-type cobalt transport system substrate-binding protein
MQDKRGEIVKFQGVVKTIPSHQQLMKVNRMLLAVVFLLMLVVIVVGFFVIPDSDVVFSKQKNNTAITNQDINPVISPEVNALKGQLIGIVSGSIESKLHSLETSIKSGTVENSLVTLADLRNDVQTLKTYSELPKKTEVEVSNKDLAKEITHLKDLIYMSLASCALMFAAAAGVWVKYRRRLPYKDIKSGFLGRR